MSNILRQKYDEASRFYASQVTEDFVAGEIPCAGKIVSEQDLLNMVDATLICVNSRPIS